MIMFLISSSVLIAILCGSDGKGEWSEMVRHVLRRDNGHILRKALEFEVKGKRK